MTYQPPPSGQQPPYGGQPPQGQPPYGAPPPPPVPSGQPGAQWAPPPQPTGASQWGAPASSGSQNNPLAGINASSVNPLDWGILAAGLLAFIFSFFSYYTVSVKSVITISAHHSAWLGFFGWFAALVALASAALLAAVIFSPSSIRLPFPVRLVVLAGFALATICVLLAWFITPDAASGFSGVSYGRGIGFYLSLIVIVVGTVLAFLRFQQSGGQLPSGMGNLRHGAAPQAGGSYGPPPVGPGQYGAPPPAGPGQYGPPPGGPGQYGPPPQQ
jgi:hypothetical protein